MSERPIEARQIGQTLETLRRQRALRREARQAVPLGTVALVGPSGYCLETKVNSPDISIARKSILLVEDDTELTSLMTDYFAQFGFEFSRAHDQEPQVRAR